MIACARYDVKLSLVHVFRFFVYVPFLLITDYSVTCTFDNTMTCALHCYLCLWLLWTFDYSVTCTFDYTVTWQHCDLYLWLYCDLCFWLHCDMNDYDLCLTQFLVPLTTLWLVALTTLWALDCYLCLWPLCDFNHYDFSLWWHCTCNNIVTCTLHCYLCLWLHWHSFKVPPTFTSNFQFYIHFVLLFHSINTSLYWYSCLHLIFLAMYSSLHPLHEEDPIHLSWGSLERR